MRILAENISFKSNGNKLLGRLYRPEKFTEKAPAIILCHGFPGDTKSMDLAEELALNGYVALIFYYQGAWGSEGKYTLTKLEENARDAIKFILSLPFIDSKRLAMIGHSMGAIPVSKTISLDKRIKTAIFLSPATSFKEMVAFKNRRRYLCYLLGLGKGKLVELNKKDLLKDLLWITEKSNPLDMIKKASIPVLVIVGSKDDVTTHRNCKRLYRIANKPKEYEEIAGADHSFSRHRIVLIDKVLSWLNTYL